MKATRNFHVTTVPFNGKKLNDTAVDIDMVFIRYKDGNTSILLKKVCGFCNGKRVFYDKEHEDAGAVCSTCGGYGSVWEEVPQEKKKKLDIRIRRVFSPRKRTALVDPNSKPVSRRKFLGGGRPSPAETPTG